MCIRDRTTVAPPAVTLPPGSHLDFLVNGNAGAYILLRSGTRVAGGPLVRNLAQHRLTPIGDLNNSCAVDVLDVTEVAAHWNLSLIHISEPTRPY